METLGSFPRIRMRRMRKDDFSRRLMREHVLTTNDLIYPVFVIEGRNRAQKVPSMPGVMRHTIDRLLKVAERALALGLMIWLGCIPGNPESNKYGEVPANGISYAGAAKPSA
jgi:delta-aminolevulinic acid dehydratase/porphobilinogen synthase